jgi:hypothetical protein
MDTTFRKIGATATTINRKIGGGCISADYSIESNTRRIRNESLSNKLKDLLGCQPATWIEERLLGSCISKRTICEEEFLDEREEDFGWRYNSPTLLVYPLGFQELQLSKGLRWIKRMLISPLDHLDQV